MKNPPPELHGPGDTVGDIVYFSRMVSKIRLHHAGNLPEDLRENLGLGFDGRCVHFLRISYQGLCDQVREVGASASDEELLTWCFTNGRQPDDDEIEVWNDFMRKRGWKDAATPTLERRKKESGLADRADIETMFQYIDADEGRPVRPVDA
ncbi:MAG: DUF5069 domain-containing protein [Verrucomicrobia bacterium]|nr:DUF5069 domain-containing protein [Verrucomicrobiota bacterium]